MTVLPRKLPQLRPRHLRIVVQAIFLLAFLGLFFALAVSRISGEVASVLLALDPVTAGGTALADWSIARWTWLGLAVIAAVELVVFKWLKWL